MIDPLRFFGILNLLGDACLIASGVTFNPVRAVSAGLGMAANIVGMAGSNRTLFGRDTGDIVMWVIYVCGLIFVVSGSNVFGFEPAPRVAEIGAGFCISLGVLANRAGRVNWGAVVFTGATCLFMFSGFEAMVNTGRPDWYVIAASCLFMGANVLSAFIRPCKKAAV